MSTPFWQTLPSKYAFAAYAGSDFTKFRAAIDQLDPTILSSGAIVTQNDIVQLNRILNRRLDSYKNQRSLCNPCAVGRAADCNAGCGTGYRCERNLWFEATGNFMNQSSDRHVRGFTAESVGFVLGADRRVSRELVLGTSFAGFFATAKDKNRPATIVLISPSAFRCFWYYY